MKIKKIREHLQNSERCTKNWPEKVFRPVFCWKTAKGAVIRITGNTKSVKLLRITCGEVKR